MFKSFIKIAFRNIVRYNIFTLINVTGLAIGIASSLLIMLWVEDEMSYDKFYDNSENIYRLAFTGVFGNSEFNTVNTAAPTAAVLKNEYKEIADATRLLKGWSKQVSFGNKSFTEDKFMFADSNFFEVFSFKLILGEPSNVLNEPNRIVLTASTANRYFGKEDPVGKILVSDSGRDFVVSGVCEDVPANSHFDFDFLGSLETLEWSHNDNWLTLSFLTYFVINPEYEIESLRPVLNDISEKYIVPQLKEYLNINMEDFSASGQTFKFEIQALTDIHLYSDLDGEIKQGGDKLYVLLFSFAAMFILIIACINFTNITTARAVNRTKEIVIRKILGSTKWQLMSQFLLESIFLSFFAMIVSLALVEILVPYFNQLTGKEMSFLMFGRWGVIISLSQMLLFVGLLSGIYPAIFLSSYNPVNVLRGGARKRIKNPILRGSLVLIQFFISITLVVSTVEIYRQLNYVSQTNLGFSRENIVAVERAYALGDNEDEFLENIRQNNNVVDACFSFTIPGKGFNTTSHRLFGRPDDELHLLHYFHTDYNLSDILNLEMKEGKFFNSDFDSDSNTVVLNEEAVKAMGIENPVGQYIIQPTAQLNADNKFRIIGVVKNFHYETLHRNIRPLAIYRRIPGEYSKYILIKCKPGMSDDVIASARKIWSDIVQSQTFSCFKYDDELNNLYADDKETGRIFLIFSVLALFLALLGMYGLALFITLQRSKEIGIRKVLGASVFRIALLLFKDFSKWIIFANLIAWPTAYYIINEWNKSFAFTVDFNLSVYILSGLFILITATIAISVQTFRAAFDNPVKALKYE